jgi:chromosome segregation ATPase
MKNFQQNLLFGLAICLCALCAYQWYAQTIQRNEIQKLNLLVYQKSVAIRDDTNSIATLNHQIAQMDAQLTGLRETVRTNRQVMADQRLELARLETLNGTLTNEIAQYKQAVDTMTARLKEAYENIKTQNESMKELVGQRDELVKKYNDSVKDRNDVVAKYNDLVAQIEKRGGAAKDQLK